MIIDHMQEIFRLEREVVRAVKVWKSKLRIRDVIEMKRLSNANPLADVVRAMANLETFVNGLEDPYSANVRLDHGEPARLAQATAVATLARVVAAPSEHTMPNWLDVAPGGATCTACNDDRDVIKLTHQYGYITLCCRCLEAAAEYAQP